MQRRGLGEARPRIVRRNSGAAPRSGAFGGQQHRTAEAREAKRLMDRRSVAHDCQVWPIARLGDAMTEEG
jgi:hypothetical protein